MGSDLFMFAGHMNWAISRSSRKTIILKDYEV